MPRYFCDFSDGSNRGKDRAGTICKDNAAALQYALEVAKELAQSPMYDDLCVEIFNEDGVRIGKAYVSQRH